jgi:hypothetical protein
MTTTITPRVQLGETRRGRAQGVNNHSPRGRAAREGAQRQQQSTHEIAPARNTGKGHTTATVTIQRAQRVEAQGVWTGAHDNNSHFQRVERPEAQRAGKRRTITTVIPRERNEGRYRRREGHTTTTVTSREQSKERFKGGDGAQANNSHSQRAQQASSVTSGAGWRARSVASLTLGIVDCGGSCLRVRIVSALEHAHSMCSTTRPERVWDRGCWQRELC